MTVLGPAPPHEDPGPITDENAADLEDALGSLGGSEAFVSCWKWAPEESTFAMCTRAPAEGFDPLVIAKRFGAGKYRFRVYVNGKMVKQSTRVIYVEDLPPGVGPAAATPTGAGPTDELLRALLARTQQQDDLQRSLLLALVTGLAQRGPGGDSGIRGADLVEAFKVGRDTSGGSIKQDTPYDPIFRAIELGMGLVSDKGGENGEPGGGLMSYVPRVLSIIENASAARAAVPAHAAPAIAAGAQTAAPAPVVDPLSQLVPKILEEARANRDPGTWGYWLGERYGVGPYRDALVAVVSMSAEERREVLVTKEPALNLYGEWIEAATEGLREALGLPGGGDEERAGDPDPDSAG